METIKECYVQGEQQAPHLLRLSHLAINKISMQTVIYGFLHMVPIFY